MQQPPVCENSITAYRKRKGGLRDQEDEEMETKSVKADLLFLVGFRQKGVVLLAKTACDPDDASAGRKNTDRQDAQDKR
jgi:CO dehydrogenase/acetyl-CoA synthase alpha subunit